MHNKSDACDDESNETEAEVNRTLFLRGFDDKTTEDELYELFLQVSLHSQKNNQSLNPWAKGHNLPPTYHIHGDED